MKHFLQACSFILILTFVMPAFAYAANFSEMYITITEAMMNTKQDKTEAAEQSIALLEQQLQGIETTFEEEKVAVEKALKQIQQADTKDARIEALTALSKAVKKLDEAENPVDEQQEREAFAVKYSTYMEQFEKALASNDVEQVKEAYKILNLKWNQYERPVRSQSVGMYGQIETQLSFMRISLSADPVDLGIVQTQYASFKNYIQRFVAGENIQVTEGAYSLETLVNLLEKAEEAVEEGQYSAAAGALTEFIVVWPNVEIEISTRNGGLYQELESDIPIVVSALSKQNIDPAAIGQQLNRYKKEIQLLQEDDGYTMWDSALILLREGLEAMLIIMVLVSFLKRAGQQQMTKWVYGGAIVGILLSIVAAVYLNVFFNSMTVNTSREIMEGYVGLIAAAMMLGVGVWLHSKSSANSWNAYLSKQMGHALSKGSVITMAAISFLSVFREGAETVIFYAGVAPKMEMSDLLMGVLVAVVILLLVALFMNKLTVKIPLHYFFAAATIFIYVLTFKIIGTSLHTLQLTDVLPTTVNHALPVISSIGFYPTTETMIGQAILIGIGVTVILYQRKVKSAKMI